jgi:hypothetical protein
MRKLTAPLLAVALAAVLVVPLAASDAAAARPASAQPSEGFCTAVSEYFQISFALSFIAAFAEGFGGDEVDPDELEDVQALFQLALSPKFAALTSTLAEDTDDRDLRKGFARLNDTYQSGVDLLREDVGLTRAQIRQIAEAEIEPDSDGDQVIEDTGANERKLRAAARKFQKQIPELELTDLGRKAARAFQGAATDCGVFPAGDLDCEELVPQDLVVAVIGEIADTETDSGCVYQGPESDDDQAELAVEVYNSAAAYDRLTEQGQNQDVPGVGDEATALEGFTSFSSFKTCGTTLVVLSGETTVTVAGCVPDGDVTADQLVPVAQAALESALLSTPSG